MSDFGVIDAGWAGSIIKPRQPASCFLAQLCEAGVIPPVPDPREDTLQRRIEDDYEAYLVHERGLASATITNYTGIARDFLAATPKQPNSLYATDIYTFIRRRSTKLSRCRPEPYWPKSFGFA